MAKSTSLKKIKELITKSSNPLYLYDDDPDGLCSYLLLKRHFKKGDGIAVKTAPRLGVGFLSNINKHNYDLLVILDKPIVEQELIDKISKPIIYIDHHPIQELKGIYYYNPRIKDKNDTSPTTKQCHDLVKEDDWIAGIGIIADWALPKFLNRLAREYPDLLKKGKSAPEIMFDQKFGVLIRIFSFILKGDNKGLKECVEILERTKSPYDILGNEDSLIFKRYHEVSKIYEELLGEAMKEIGDEKLVAFSYISGKVSLTGDLSNEIYYRCPGKFVVIAREKDNEMKLSIRGKNALKFLQKALVGIDGYGGGHDNACGGAINKRDFTRFLRNLREAL